MTPSGEQDAKRGITEENEGSSAATALEGEGGGDSEERWISGAELEGFKGDWLALARKRTGRTASGVSAAAAAPASSAQGRRRGGDIRDSNAVSSRPSFALYANVRDKSVEFITLLSLF